MITVSFLSGEIVQFDDLFDGATIYNLKRTICDWLIEKDGKEIDISLVHLYDFETNEECFYSQPLPHPSEPDEHKIYKVFIGQYQRRIIYLKNGIVRYHLENEPRCDSDTEIKSVETLCDEHNILHYFDCNSFTSSWKEDHSFFHQHGYSLRDENDYYIYPYESEYEYEDDEDDEENWDEYKIENRTRECLSSIFKKLKIKWWI